MRTDAAETDARMRHIILRFMTHLRDLLTRRQNLEHRNRAFAGSKGFRVPEHPSRAAQRGREAPHVQNAAQLMERRRRLSSGRGRIPQGLKARVAVGSEGGR